MDPFTEKLLERTRARRENLQKKMAERPAAANRQMTKRTREPLAETNSMLSEPVIDEALHPSTKPSPSKRRCSSEENAQPPAARGKSEENREPGPGDVPALQDPPTDRKPPAGPGRVRSAASLEQKAVATAQVATAQAATAQVTVQPIPEQTKAEEMVTSSAPPPLAPPRKEAEDGEGPKEAPTPAASGGMRSRLQRLAEQRHYWDNDASDDAPPSPVKRLPEAAPPVVAPAASTEPPVGRKGRLANLAATIGCWEDDLSRPTSRAYGEQAQPAAAAGVGRMTCRQAASPAPKQSAAMANSKPLPSSAQSAQSPFKSSKVAAPSPQKADVPAGRLGGMSPAASPQKSSNKAGPNPAVPPTPQSPLKNQVPSRCLDLNASPSKLGLPAKPATSGPTSVPLGREKLAAKEPSTPQQQKATGTPVVKSFLERFGEKCQERANQSTSTAGGAQLKNPRVTPSVTPNTKLVQERLRAAQAASTTTADLTQRQKLERETELAQIRSRFQKGNNVWKNKEEVADDKEPSTEYEVAKSQPKVVLAEAGPDTPRTPSIFTSAGIGLAGTPPNSTSSPLRMVNRPVAPVEGPFDDETPPDETSSEEVVREIEMNVDASINSAVINELFECVLEQSDDTPSSANHREDEEDEDDDEEDALNISSMSLLTPLAATVASVVKSPERRMLMTSTPAGSFIEKRETPNSGASTPSKFQRARVTRTGSSDSVESLDEDHKLPYSVDAYRSIRVKETERPHVKQVIVRKEDVSLRTPEPRGPGAHVGIKQRMKDLTNEMNLQQMVIHQASQALNCCTDEEHGKGSPVEAEAERLLLVATEKRAALKAELDRMKGEGPKKPPAGPSRAPKDMGVPASKGSITLQELRLPLKADFVCATANKPDSGSHYFFLMIRAGAEHTVATPLASTRSALSGDALSFTTKFTMSDVSNDFEVDIQVYSLVLKRALSHDKKKKAVKSKAMTPKRFLAITKSNHTPVMASPGGPNAVRTSNFVLVGSHRLTLASVGKNKFPLEKIKYEGRERELLSDMFHKKVPFLCPLEGHIYLKMQCQVGSSVVEERGFLTMFEDVSGFGAWHRRWCVLSGYCISYWTYPDDERRKSPIGRINLANCTSRRVEPANREFCARPNTMELITVRPRREDDRETLVSQCQNTMCVTKNWLSADTKDERNLWMQKLNQILVDLRMWQPDSCLTPP